MHDFFLISGKKCKNHLGAITFRELLFTHGRICPLSREREGCGREGGGGDNGAGDERGERENFNPFM